MRKALLAFSIIALTLFSVGLYVASLPQSEFSKAIDQAIAARIRLHEGMSRAEAEQALSDAWHHDVCGDRGYFHHLFFYGDADTIDQSTLIYLRTETKEGQEMVSYIGGVDNYRLFLWEDCSTLDLSKVKRY